jgi:hypothetical protein
MSELRNILLEETRRPSLVKDCVRVIEDEVAGKSGMGGLVIKTAFKTVKAFKPGIIPDVVNVLVDDFVDQLEPTYVEFNAQGGGDIKGFLLSRSDKVADELLSITDGRAQKSKHRTLVKAYNKLRPQGKKQVVSAMPRIGDMLVRQGL